MKHKRMTNALEEVMESIKSNCEKCGVHTFTFQHRPFLIDGKVNNKTIWACTKCIEED